jgi:N-dimethylarginine dimethylaminohydrolase
MGKIDKAALTKAGQIPDVYLLEQIDYMDEIELVWGRRWGAQSEIGKLITCMVSRPTENDVNEDSEKDPTHYIFHGTPRLKVLQKQHDDFVSVLKGEGVEVVYLDPPVPCVGPYGQKVRTWGPASAFVINGGAIIPRYGWAPWRRGREVNLAKRLMQIGCPILHTTHGKGILELGGNGQWLDPRHLVIGIGATTNLEGVDQIRPLLARAGVEEIHLAYFNDTIHLDVCFGLASAWVGVVDKRKLHFNTFSYLKKKGIDLIEATPEESDNFACNIIALEPGKVVIPSGNPKTTKALKERGVTVIDLDFSDFIKMEGGPHCCVSSLIREPGPYLPK